MSNRIKLSLGDIQLISLFENVTHANVKDCIVSENNDKITFVVNEGQAGIAIGKGGINVKNLEARLKKKIEILEYSDDPLRFISNLFRPITVNNAYISEKSSGEKVLHASISKGNLGMIKSKMRKVKELLDKYYHFSEVIFD
jgi:N utilization substance protein A